MARLVSVLLIVVDCVGAVVFTQRSRTIEGTWLWQPEGSEFFEGQTPQEVCNLYSRKSSWLEYDITKVYPHWRHTGRYPSSGWVTYQNLGPYRIEAFSVRFEGRFRLTPLSGGHLGSWNSEYDVHRMLSFSPIGGLDCKDVRF